MDNNNMDKDIEKAMKNSDYLQVLLRNILSKDDKIRFSSFQILFAISKKYPEVLYQYWNHFVKMLSSKNSFHQSIAIRLLAYLTQIDTENKFDPIFETYFGIIEKGKTMTSIQAIENAGIIAKFKKNYQFKITSLLLNFENIYKGKQTELMKAAVIQAFDYFFIESEQKKEIIDFVKKSQKSDSPKTRKLSVEFLKKYSKFH